MFPNAFSFPDSLVSSSCVLSNESTALIAHSYGDCLTAGCALELPSGCPNTLEGVYPLEFLEEWDVGWGCMREAELEAEGYDGASPGALDAASGTSSSVTW